MRCDECKFWDRKQGKDYANVGRCTKAQPFWEVSEWQKWEHIGDGDAADHWRRGLKPQFRDLKLFVQDGSDFNAYMLTAPDFYCAHHEPK